LRSLLAGRWASALFRLLGAGGGMLPASTLFAAVFWTPGWVSNHRGRLIAAQMHI
jgi:hypothetical protein